MFQINFSIANPFHRYDENAVSKDFFAFEKKISSHRSIDCQLTKWEANDILKFRLNLIWWGSDHAGPSISIEVLGLYFNFSVYRHEHWNYEKDRWYRYDEDPDGE